MTYDERENSPAERRSRKERHDYALALFSEKS
jgi:hypothetical protein